MTGPIALLLSVQGACRNAQKCPAMTADEPMTPLWRELYTVESDQIIVHACERRVQVMAPLVLIWIACLPVVNTRPDLKRSHRYLTP